MWSGSKGPKSNLCILEEKQNEHREQWISLRNWINHKWKIQTTGQGSAALKSYDALTLSSKACIFSPFKKKNYNIIKKKKFTAIIPLITNPKRGNDVRDLEVTSWVSIASSWSTGRAIWSSGQSEDVNTCQLLPSHNVYRKWLRHSRRHSEKNGLLSLKGSAGQHPSKSFPCGADFRL